MRDFGDFQTPPDVVDAVVNRVFADFGSTWHRALEPTAGQGRFIQALLRQPVPPTDIMAIEIQAQHVDELRNIARSQYRSQGRVSVLQANVFETDLARLPWRSDGRLLVIGNPPWVTNSELGALGSTNVPTKRNVTGLQGMAAMTGAANFDLAEAVWLKLLLELAPQRPTIALLCKTSVARDVLSLARHHGIGLTKAAIYRIDAKRSFQAAVDACLFVATVDAGLETWQADVFSALDQPVYEATISAGPDLVVRDHRAYSLAERFDGHFAVEWRQGVKHDAVRVMELTSTADGSLANGMQERVLVEDDYVFPLLKSSDLHRGRSPSRWLVVPQRSISSQDRTLSTTAPRLWSYLTGHSDVFARRKSSIYRGKSLFSIFGVGPYSFTPYKVAVAGLYANPRFRALAPVGERPVLLDDTCYFLPCSSGAQASVLACVLNAPAIQDFVRAFSFPGSKRPVTKALLKRLDLLRVLESLDLDALREEATATLSMLMGTHEAEPGNRLLRGDLAEIALGEGQLELVGSRRDDVMTPVP